MGLSKSRFIPLWAAAAACLVVLGCGGGGTTVEGTVNLDGQPVDGGSISFLPTGQGTNAGAKINGGKYVIEPGTKLAPGSYRVEINWMKATGKQIPNTSDPGTSVDEVKQVIPMEYNSKTKLTAEVKSGSNRIDFDLKGGGPIDQTKPGSPPKRTKAVGD